MEKRQITPLPLEKRPHRLCFLEGTRISNKQGASYYGKQRVATRLGAFWECCWVHCIDPRNSGDASDIAPEILEELVHFASVEPEPARIRRPSWPSIAEAIKPALDPPGITLQVR